MVDGDRVILTVDAAGEMKASQKTRAADESLHAPQADPRVETLGVRIVGANSAEAGTAVATFRNYGPRGGTLKVESGFDHPVIYDAAILVRRGRSVVAERTSICPVIAHGVGEEAWGEPIEGVVIYGLREPAKGDLSCSNGSGLTAAAVDPHPRNVCVGEVPGSALSVRLFVDPATGAEQSAEAVWTLRGASPFEGPWLMLDYPMQKGVVGARPFGMQVVAGASLSPPPKAKSASIVVLADGVEAARLPWRLFSDRRAASGSIPAGAQAVGFYGVIPFSRTDLTEAPTSLVELYARIGDGSARRVEVRVVGDDGSVLSKASYALQPAAVNDTRAIAAALAAARARAAGPSHCAQAPQPR